MDSSNKKVLVRISLPSETQRYVVKLDLLEDLFDPQAPKTLQIRHILDDRRLSVYLRYVQGPWTIGPRMTEITVPLQQSIVGGGIIAVVVMEFKKGVRANEGDLIGKKEITIV